MKKTSAKYKSGARAGYDGAKRRKGTKPCGGRYARSLARAARDARRRAGPRTGDSVGSSGTGSDVDALYISKCVAAAISEIRRNLRMNQAEFWSRIGVTQSGGCRYEKGRTMPKPVRELLRLVHIEGVELSRAKGEDLEIVAYMKQSDPGLYRSLRKAALTETRRKQ